MLEDSARAGKERDCRFYHHMVKGKKGLSWVKEEPLLYTRAAEKLTGMGEEPMAAIVSEEFFFL